MASSSNGCQPIFGRQRLFGGQGLRTRAIAISHRRAATLVDVGQPKVSGLLRPGQFLSDRVMRQPTALGQVVIVVKTKHAGASAESSELWERSGLNGAVSVRGIAP